MDRLRPAARNARRHDETQIQRIADSMRQFGWTAPVLADPSGEIIAGEARWKAGQLLGLDEAPVVILDGLTDAQREAYRIADNRLAEHATWDEELLASILVDLDNGGFDLQFTGYDELDIARLVADITGEDPQADIAVPPPASPITVLGDVWQLGRHRLICGDSTKAETLTRLMQAAPAQMAMLDADTADLVFTDPPYGMAYDGGRAIKPAALVFTDPPYGMSFGAGKEAGSTAKGALVKAHGMILNDDVRGEQLVALVGDALARAVEYSRKGAAAYVCFTWRTYADFECAVRAAGLAVAACIVWDKESIGLGHQHYRPQHEFIFYCRGERWFGGKAESDIWRCTRGNTGEYVHPTQKPVSLIERAIINSSRPGEIVLDLFGGSGSTLIAAERTGRQARLVELDPKYCDAIVARFEAFTGEKGIRVPA
jgi:DNA modification methylase